MQTYQKHINGLNGHGKTPALLAGLGLLLVSTVATAIWFVSPTPSATRQQAGSSIESTSTVASNTGEVDLSSLSTAPALLGTVLKESTLEAIDP